MLEWQVLMAGAAAQHLAPKTAGQIAALTDGHVAIHPTPLHSTHYSQVNISCCLLAVV
jgi:hypothetical protein